MHVLDRLWKTISNAAGGMGDHRGTQLAAGMAYYGVLSIFPAAIEDVHGALPERLGLFVVAGFRMFMRRLGHHPKLQRA